MDSKTMQFEITSGSEGDKHPSVWSSPEGGQKIDIGKQIFCNRSLNMKNIVAVGFDMDYTLAQYKSETFESLAYEGTVKKLVNDLGYPTEVVAFSSFLDWFYIILAAFVIPILLVLCSCWSGRLTGLTWSED